MENANKGLDSVLASIDASLDQEFEQRLRAELEQQDHAWLVQALTHRLLQERHLAAAPQRQLAREAQHVETLAQRRQRLARIEALGLDEQTLRDTVARFAAVAREQYLVDPPHKGRESLGPRQRTPEGETLLQKAHDLFYALLFCDSQQGVRLTRSRRDFLTVTLPSKKASLLERFMLAVTETQASGTWLDPEGVSDDIGARNTILQVEFGDTADELVSDALIAVLKMINDLEVNEEILYARIEQLEKSTLID